MGTPRSGAWAIGCVWPGAKHPSSPVPCYERVHGTTNAAAAGLLQDVRIDHGRLDVGVAEELLDCADVVAVFQEVRGEGVTQGVAAGIFLDARGLDGSLCRPLYCRFLEVMSSLDSAPRVDGSSGGGKDVLSRDFASGAWIFACERVAGPDVADTVSDVPFVLGRRNLLKLRQRVEAVRR